MEVRSIAFWLQSNISSKTTKPISDSFGFFSSSLPNSSVYCSGDLVRLKALDQKSFQLFQFLIVFTRKGQLYNQRSHFVNYIFLSFMFRLPFRPMKLSAVLAKNFLFKKRYL